MGTRGRMINSLPQRGLSSMRFTIAIEEQARWQRYEVPSQLSPPDRKHSRHGETAEKSGEPGVADEQAVELTNQPASDAIIRPLLEPALA